MTDIDALIADLNACRLSDDMPTLCSEAATALRELQARCDALEAVIRSAYDAPSHGHALIILGQALAAHGKKQN